MKVLLLNPPAPRLVNRDVNCSHSSKAAYIWPQVDHVVLSGILSRDHDVAVIDAVAERMTTQACLARIHQAKPDAIMFLTGSVSSNTDFPFLRQVKQQAGALVVAMGDVFLDHSYTLKVLAEQDYLDAILLDFSTYDILEYLKDPQSGAVIKNVVYRKNGQAVDGKRVAEHGPCEIHRPLHELFPLDRYNIPLARHGTFTCAYTNFGCPFTCTFCPASVLDFKYRVVPNVMEELRFLVKLGVKEVWFRDYTFAAHKKQTRELCQAMIEEKLNLKWFCLTRVDVVDEEMLTLMKQAGCHTVTLGVETANEDLLVKYQKNINLARVRQIFKKCKELNLDTLAHFILGLPGETVQSAERTIAFAKEIDPDFATFNVITPRLGTGFREYAIQEGYAKNGLTNYDQSNDYPTVETELLTKEQLWDLRNRAIREFFFRPKFIARKITKINSPRTLLNLASNGLALMQSVAARDGGSMGFEG